MTWKHVRAAILLTQAVGARANIHDDRIFGLGQIGNGEQILGLEIGDDKGIAFGEDLLGLGHYVGILGHARLDELKGVADEATRLVRLLDDETRALDALVEDRFLRVGERQRFLVFLAEIDDRHGGLDLRLAGIRVLRFGSFRWRGSRRQAPPEERPAQQALVARSRHARARAAERL